MLLLALLAIFGWSCTSKNDSGDGGSAACTQTFDLPLNYSIVRDGSGNPNHVAIQTAGGPIKYVFAPNGTHAEPHSGHPGSELKNNGAGFLAQSGATTTLLEELDGDNDGVCEFTDSKCGMLLTDMRQRIPMYIAPTESYSVSSLVLIKTGTTEYLDTTHQWDLQTGFCNYSINLGHVGKMSALLRQRMIAQGDPDPDTYMGPTGVNIISKPIAFSRGEEIAQPQIVGLLDVAHPGYAVGPARNHQPWAQLEFPTLRLDPGSSTVLSPFSLLPDSVKSDLTSILHREMLDPDSLYYGGYESTKWRYRAEGVLDVAGPVDSNQITNLFGNNGIWQEYPSTGSCTAGSTLCDHAFVIWPIATETAVYDSSLYDSASVKYLVLKSVHGDAYYAGEVLSPSDPNGLTGTLLLKWRERVTAALTPVTYQKVSYSVDVANKMMRIRYGVEDSDRAAVVAAADPAIPLTDACDGTAVLCLLNQQKVNLPGF